jgi:hypothetical protein
VHTWALALGCLGIQMWLVSFTWLSSIMIGGLLPAGQATAGYALHRTIGC